MLCLCEHLSISFNCAHTIQMMNDDDDDDKTGRHDHDVYLSLF